MIVPSESFFLLGHRYTPAKKVLIVVPINTLQNWLCEFNMWVPDVSGSGEKSETEKQTQENAAKVIKKKMSSEKTSQGSDGVPKKASTGAISQGDLTASNDVKTAIEKVVEDAGGEIFARNSSGGTINSGGLEEINDINLSNEKAFQDVLGMDMEEKAPFKANFEGKGIDEMASSGHISEEKSVEDKETLNQTNSENKGTEFVDEKASVNKTLLGAVVLDAEKEVQKDNNSEKIGVENTEKKFAVETASCQKTTNDIDSKAAKQERPNNELKFEANKKVSGSHNGDITEKECKTESRYTAEMKPPTIHGSSTGTANNASGSKQFTDVDARDYKVFLIGDGQKSTINRAKVIGNIN